MKINKQFLILLLVGFIGAQLMTAAHAARYGGDKHTHDGQICQTYLQRDQGQAAAPAPFVLTAVAVNFVWRLPIEKQQIVIQKSHIIAAPRGPPQIS